MILQILKQEKKYSVPGYCINWTMDKNILKLKIRLDSNKYTENNLILPPVNLGRCKDWYFDISDIYTFTAVWDIRRVKDKLENIPSIINDIKPYSVLNNIECH